MKRSSRRHTGPYKINTPTGNVTESSLLHHHQVRLLWLVAVFLLREVTTSLNNRSSKRIRAVAAANEDTEADDLYGVIGSPRHQSIG
jgi:hypothetical protein